MECNWRESPYVVVGITSSCFVVILFTITLFLHNRYSNLERHLSLGKCDKMVERSSLMDLAKTKYASLLEEGVGVIPNLASKERNQGSNRPVLEEGWSLKKSSKHYRFNEKQKGYLLSKFNVGVASGRKVNPDVVAKEMRRCLGPDKERMFTVSEFLTGQQIKSFFSRQAAKQNISDADILAAQEETNFSDTQQAILASFQIEHPIMFEQYNLCAMEKTDSFHKLKLTVLKSLCHNFKLNLENVKDGRKKAPYIALLKEFAASCQCCI